MMKVCTECGRGFLVTGRNHKYCVPECRARGELNKQYRRKYMRKWRLRRNGKDNQVTV
jgi:hypothetical protein